jgi:hypothetical protein
MPSVMTIQGKVENIWDDEDFARMLRDRLGDDAERYFRDSLSYHDRNPSEFGYPCSGECDKVYELQEHYEQLLKETRYEIASWKTRKWTKDELDSKRAQLIQKIDSEL